MQTESDARLLAELQRSLPLAVRPFAQIGRTLDRGEDEVIETTARLLDSGVIRRLGAFFDARRLGYETTLVAADIGEADPDRVAAPIVSHPCTTHVYLRDGRPALWYTLHARGDEALRDSIQTLERATGVNGMLDLRAERIFKLRVLFDATSGTASVGAPDIAAPARPRPHCAELPDDHVRIVRALAEGIRPVAEPWGKVAESAGTDTAHLLETLQLLLATGVLRRTGASVNHRALGFGANAMAVWTCPVDHVEAAGTALAKSAMVSHCYIRRSYPAWPMNLYAMCHTQTRERLLEETENLRVSAGLDAPRLLSTLREIKKMPARYFAEDTHREDPGR